MVERAKVFVTRQLPEAGMARMHEFADVEMWPEELPPPYDVLREKAQAFQGLVTLVTDPVDAALLKAGRGSLKVVSQMAVGVDNIDLVAATANGIPVGHTPGVVTGATADFTFALMLGAARRIVEGAEYVRAGRWRTWGPTLLMGQDVYGAALGIVGFGRIGQAVAKRAMAFGMRIMYYDPTADPDEGAPFGAVPVSLARLLSEADFVSLHVPLTAQTRHMIGTTELAQMKPNAILINVARGPVVDQKALYHALRDGTINYAALDVTDPEPLPMDDPLLTLPNCLIVPHTASSTVATRTRMAMMAAENLIAGLRGERLPHCANPDVYGR